MGSDVTIFEILCHVTVRTEIESLCMRANFATWFGEKSFIIITRLG